MRYIVIKFQIQWLKLKAHSHSAFFLIRFLLLQQTGFTGFNGSVHTMRLQQHHQLLCCPLQAKQIAVAIRKNHTVLTSPKYALFDVPGLEVGAIGVAWSSTAGAVEGACGKGVGAVPVTTCATSSSESSSMFSTWCLLTLIPWSAASYSIFASSLSLTKKAFNTMLTETEKYRK